MPVRTENGDISDVLRQVELNIIPNITCVENFSPISIIIRDAITWVALSDSGGIFVGSLKVKNNGKDSVAGKIWLLLHL